MARTLLASGIVALPAAPWLCLAIARAATSALGRDQGIFQYVAWALAQGEKLYGDVRDVNGPLVAMIHLALQGLGGVTEHRFRSLDLALTSATFAFVGAALPSISRRAASAFERACWSVATTVVLLGQYLAYGFWDTAQRESFFDGFLAVALGALLLAQARRAADRPTLGWLVLAGCCSVAPVFGKPTYALFTAVHVAAVALDRDAEDRLRRLGAFATGGAAATLAVAVFVARYGDLAAYLRITFEDVPSMYRFIWPRSPRGLLSLPGYSTTAIVAVTASALACALVIARRLPSRALPMALVPTLGLVSVLAQAKGFPYHFHPVSFGIGLVGVALVLVATERAPLVLAGALAVLLGVRTAARARDASAITRAEELHGYERIDFFPARLRETAAFIAANTRAEDRVQLYGMDPYVLFLARRRSATQYIYAYDLNVDAALHGSFDPDGPRPSPEQADHIRAMRDAHERILVDSLDRTPPAAFVFIDRSPLMSRADALADFELHCPQAALRVRRDYVETANVAGMRVWARVMR